MQGEELLPYWPFHENQKLHLNQKGAKLLSDIFVKELSKVFNWHNLGKSNRVTSGMSLSKKHTLMNAFFNSQFNYCPLIWMCHSRENNNKINGLHEKCLRIISNEKRSSFNALLEKDGSVSLHERNIKILATEMFKVSENIAPPQMHEIFSV